ncbi:MAG: hypothetical protein FJ295_17700 [Planctomycetes bacterium]|nr:hypothetical protein [Planctomycetota bacterium]
MSRRTGKCRGPLSAIRGGIWLPVCGLALCCSILTARAMPDDGARAEAPGPIGASNASADPRGSQEWLEPRAAAELAQRTATVPGAAPTDDFLRPFPGEYFPPPDDDWLACDPKLSSFKSGFFQKLSLQGTWLDRGHADDLGITEVELFATFALPMPVKEWPMLITPYFNQRLLTGPNAPDLPATLYETYVEFLWVPRFNERLIGILGVAPSVYSDFQASDADGFRLTGKGLVRYDIVPDRWQLLAGVLYLNRDDIRLLPAGGITWTPNDDIRYELIFPRPKLAHRISFTNTSEDWVYVAGEFGGNSFAVLRDSGLQDKVTLRDMRFLVGWERKRNGGAGIRFEAGYVFARSIEFRSGTPDVEPDPTILLRAGIAF